MNRIDYGDRILVPQWLPFRKAAQLREADVTAANADVIDYAPSVESFRDVVQDFHSEPSPFVGAELMGIAVVLGETEVARELARYVASEKIVGAVAAKHATAILEGHYPAELILTEQALIRNKKRRVRDFPRDALAWIDQARLYTILGQREKARKAVVASLQLAPTNRLIVRSAIRFFAHFNEWDAAAFYGERAYNATHDPLILGPLLGVFTEIDKLPLRVKPIAQKALISPDHFLFSEVLAAIGTMEILNGAQKRSRRFFRRAWRDPTQAVVSQSQWVLREHLPNLAPEQNIDFSQSAEALSWLRFAILDFKGAVLKAQDWVLEEPYSGSAHVHASHSACLIGDYTEAEATAERGLKANRRDPALLNNLVFAQLRRGRIGAAEANFELLRPLLNDPKEIAPMATYGLLLMSQSHILEGIACYDDAISRARQMGDSRAAFRASVNLLISILENTKRVDTERLRAVTASLKNIQDASCLGTALILAARLGMADLTKSRDLDLSVTEFIQTIDEAQHTLLGSAFATSIRDATETTGSDG
jgi:tetratricopeptide (TPR) repeat protein